MVEKYQNTKIVMDGIEYLVLYSMEKENRVYAMICDSNDSSKIRFVEIKEVEDKVSLEDINEDSLKAELLVLANKEG